MGSVPAIERTMPISPAIRPFVMDLPETVEIIVKPKKARAAYSGAEKLVHNAASFGAAKTRIAQLTSEPTPLAKAAHPNASAALPFFDMGYPSKVVTTADGVPGMLSRMLATAPPAIPPT